MVNPISFLWRQFNGPQVSAICQVVYEYFKDLVDSSLDYFDRLTISTANSQHLTFLGILQSLARPLVPIPNETMFLFTHEPVQDNSDRGFAPEHIYYGDYGKFDEENFSSGYSYIPDYLFRALLRGNASSKGYLGSLIALDDMLYSIWKIEHDTIVPIYTFRWADESDTRYTPADLFVNLGNTGDWTYPYETSAELTLLGQTVYYPIPKLIPIIYEGESSLDPYGFVRILLCEDSGVPGLAEMWLDPPQTPADYVPNGEDPEFEVSPIATAEEQLMWQQDNTWIDEDAPTLEFQAMRVEEIQEMWN